MPINFEHIYSTRHSSKRTFELFSNSKTQNEYLIFIRDFIAGNV